MGLWQVSYLGGWSQSLEEVVPLAFHGLAIGKLKLRNKWLYIVHCSLEREFYHSINIGSSSVQQLDYNDLGEYLRDLCT